MKFSKRTTLSPVRHLTSFSTYKGGMCRSLPNSCMQSSREFHRGSCFPVSRNGSDALTAKNRKKISCQTWQISQWIVSHADDSQPWFILPIRQHFITDDQFGLSEKTVLWVGNLPIYWVQSCHLVSSSNNLGQVYHTTFLPHQGALASADISNISL